MSPFVIKQLLNHVQTMETPMPSAEEKAIKMKLRENRRERQKLKERRELLKIDTTRLQSERKMLMARAAELGIQIGKPAKAAKAA